MTWGDVAMLLGAVLGLICLIGAVVATVRREPSHPADSDYRDEI